MIAINYDQVFNAWNLLFVAWSANIIIPESEQVCPGSGIMVIVMAVNA